LYYSAAISIPYSTLLIKFSIMTKVKVEAPSNLEEGYQLTAEVDGTAVVVIVPEGGVKQGEEFEGTPSLVVVATTC
jgi:hypothetical protein